MTKTFTEIEADLQKFTQEPFAFSEFDNVLKEVNWTLQMYEAAKVWLSAQPQCWNPKYLELQFLIVMAIRGDDEVKDRVCELVCSFDWNEMLDVQGTHATIGWFLCLNEHMVAAMVESEFSTVDIDYCDKLIECNFDFHLDTGPYEGVTITRLLLSTKAFVQHCFTSDLHDKLFAADWTISPKAKNNQSNIPLVLLYYKNEDWDDLGDAITENDSLRPKILEADWEAKFDFEPNSIPLMVAEAGFYEFLPKELCTKLCLVDWNKPGNESIKLAFFSRLAGMMDVMDEQLEHVKLILSIFFKSKNKNLINQISSYNSIQDICRVMDLCLMTGYYKDSLFGELERELSKRDWNDIDSGLSFSVAEHILDHSKLIPILLKREDWRFACLNADWARISLHQGRLTHQSLARLFIDKFIAVSDEPQPFRQLPNAEKFWDKLLLVDWISDAKIGMDGQLNKWCIVSTLIESQLGLSLLAHSESGLEKLAQFDAVSPVFHPNCDGDENPLRLCHVLADSEEGKAILRAKPSLLLNHYNRLGHEACHAVITRLLDSDTDLSAAALLLGENYRHRSIELEKQNNFQLRAQCLAQTMKTAAAGYLTLLNDSQSTLVSEEIAFHTLVQSHLECHFLKPIISHLIARYSSGIEVKSRAQKLSLVLLHLYRQEHIEQNLTIEQVKRVLVNLNHALERCTPEYLTALYNVKAERTLLAAKLNLCEFLNQSPVTAAVESAQVNFQQRHSGHTLGGRSTSEYTREAVRNLRLRHFDRLAGQGTVSNKRPQDDNDAADDAASHCEKKIKTHNLS